MEFVDTHCHIQSIGAGQGERSTRELWAKANLQADQVVADAVAAGVSTMLCVGCDVADSQLAIDFVQDRPECYASVAIHPHEAAAAPQSASFSALAQLAQQPKVVAIGECGLDYFYEHSPRDEQIKALTFQLQLAVDNNLPVIFHVREAFEDFWPIFDSFAGHIRGVLHSYTDSQANLDKALQRGLYLGVNGIATFAKQPSQLEMYKAIPNDHLLLETDAPFLTPTPFRGTINQPKQITTVAAFLSELRNQPIEELAQITTGNAQALFAV